jgi:hypothetical protein
LEDNDITVLQDNVFAGLGSLEILYVLGHLKGQSVFIVTRIV